MPQDLGGAVPAQPEACGDDFSADLVNIASRDRAARRHGLRAPAIAEMPALGGPHGGDLVQGESVPSVPGLGPFLGDLPLRLIFTILTGSPPLALGCD